MHITSTPTFAFTAAAHRHNFKTANRPLAIATATFTATTATTYAAQFNLRFGRRLTSLAAIAHRFGDVGHVAFCTLAACERVDAHDVDAGAARLDVCRLAAATRASQHHNGAAVQVCNRTPRVKSCVYDENRRFEHRKILSSLNANLQCSAQALSFFFCTLVLCTLHLHNLSVFVFAR